MYLNCSNLKAINIYLQKYFDYIYIHIVFLFTYKIVYILEAFPYIRNVLMYVYRVCLFLKTIDSMVISAYIIVIIQIITYLHTIIIVSLHYRNSLLFYSGLILKMNINFPQNRIRKHIFIIICKVHDFV